VVEGAGLGRNEGDGEGALVDGAVLGCIDGDIDGALVDGAGLGGEEGTVDGTPVSPELDGGACPIAGLYTSTSAYHGLPAPTMLLTLTIRLSLLS
jgi:hypothetical protein